MSKIAKARKVFMDTYFGKMKKVIKKHPSLDMVEEYLTSLSDKVFHEMMVNAKESGKFAIPFYEPNFNKNEVTLDQWLELGEQVGVELREEIIMVDPDSGREYTPPVKVLLFEIPFRRQSQHLVKKMALAEDDKRVDLITGQPTGDSKTSSISMPELNVISSKGLQAPLMELLKVRGGDPKAFRSMKKQISETGTFSIDAIESMGSHAKVNDTIQAFLDCMHLENNITQG